VIRLGQDVSHEMQETYLQDNHSDLLDMVCGGHHDPSVLLRLL